MEIYNRWHRQSVSLNKEKCAANCSAQSKWLTGLTADRSVGRSAGRPIDRALLLGPSFRPTQRKLRQGTGVAYAKTISQKYWKIWELRFKYVARWHTNTVIGLPS